MEYVYSEVDKKLFMFDDDLNRVSLDLKRAAGQLQRQVKRIECLEATLALKDEAIETAVTGIVSKLAPKLYPDFITAKEKRIQVEADKVSEAWIDELVLRMSLAHQHCFSFEVKKPVENRWKDLEEIIYQPPYCKGLTGELTIKIKNVEALEKMRDTLKTLSNRLTKKGATHKVVIQLGDEI